MNTSSKNEIKTYLHGTLKELNKLAGQIRDTQDYSEHAECLLALREMILEQIEVSPGEDSHPTTHALR